MSKFSDPDPKFARWLKIIGTITGVPGLISLLNLVTAQYASDVSSSDIYIIMVCLPTAFVCWVAVGGRKLLAPRGQHQRELGYWQKRREVEAEAAAAGHKPYGAPWSATHGSAYFMTTQQIMDAGYGFQRVDTTLPFLGAQAQKAPDGTPQGRFVQYNAPGHLLTAAPTRSGKGTAAVIPNLVGYTGSVIVNDTKGENFDITANRRQRMGHEVFKFAPFDDDTCIWNPMDAVSIYPENGWEDAVLLADMLLVPTGGAEAQYFEDRARNFLTGVILHVAMTCTGENRSIAHVRHLLTLPRSDFNALLAEMADSEAAAVRRAANLLLDAEDKQREQITATLDSQMAIWDSERLADATSGTSEFRFRDLKEFGPNTIYIKVPPEKLNRYKALLRVFFGQAIHEQTRTPGQPDPPILFLLDEFPALGRMRPIEDAIPYLAGYGVRLWLFAQDLAQLRNAYGEGADTILANCGCWQFFGVNDMTTARMVSDMTGHTTVATVNRSADAGWLNPFDQDHKGPQYAISQTARPLMAPDEVVNLDPAWQLVFINGLRPICCELLPYHDVPAMRDVCDTPGSSAPRPEMRGREYRQWSRRMAELGAQRAAPAEDDGATPEREAHRAGSQAADDGAAAPPAASGNSGEGESAESPGGAEPSHKAPGPPPRRPGGM